VLVLVGPTASGKTDISIELSKLVNGEIISADSRQIFTHLDIGTAKPTVEQLDQVRHYFINELSPDTEFSAGEFGEKGRIVIDQILTRKKTPVVVGGSGLYVKSLIDGFFEGPSADKEFREVLKRRITAGELPQLIEELRRVDPLSAQRIDPTKPRRIVRALEVFHITGRPLSAYHSDARIHTDFVPAFFGLDWERSVLYLRINHRCERIINDGLLDEVERLAELGHSPTLNALNTVGYAEAFAYRRGEITKEEMMRLFKQNSRRYAKRQLTWFRRDARIQWLAMDEKTQPSDVARRIAQIFLHS
jgi:tRNA dimethylallyltransferase